MTALPRATLVLSALALASCASTGAPRASNPDAGRQLERIGSLEGEWVVLPENGLPPGQTVDYRVLGDGATVVETLFAGTPGEMVTVYHRDGPDLVLTHYCSLGNQPRMVAVPSTDPGKIVFRFAGGANFDPSKDRHMRGLELTFVDEASFKARWTLHEGPEPIESTEFTLVRSWR
jgi:hypothetical protein